MVHIPDYNDYTKFSSCGVWAIIWKDRMEICQMYDFVEEEQQDNVFIWKTNSLYFHRDLKVVYTTSPK